MTFSLQQITFPRPKASQVIADDGSFTHAWAGLWRSWFNALNGNIKSQQANGFTGTVALAKLTAGGTNGSLTVTLGIITAYVPPT